MQVVVTSKKEPVQESTSAALSDAQKEYRKFFRKTLKDSGRAHPFEGDEDEVADFFLTVSEGWAAYKKENGINVA